MMHTARQWGIFYQNLYLPRLFNFVSLILFLVKLGRLLNNSLQLRSNTQLRTIFVVDGYD